MIGSGSAAPPRDSNGTARAADDMLYQRNSDDPPVLPTTPAASQACQSCRRNQCSGHHHLRKQVLNGGLTTIWTSTAGILCVITLGLSRPEDRSRQPRRRTSTCVSCLLRLASAPAWRRTSLPEPHRTRLLPAFLKRKAVGEVGLSDWHRAAVNAL